MNVARNKEVPYTPNYMARADLLQKSLLLYSIDRITQLAIIITHVVPREGRGECVYLNKMRSNLVLSQQVQEANTFSQFMHCLIIVSADSHASNVTR